jgi:putative two-component system response regulator
MMTRTARTPVLAMAATIALTHHERWDGTGYPCGLAGNDIPLEGRITAVADVFDALTSHRPYKPAFSVEKSLKIMRQGGGTQFDPAVIDAFLDGIDEILQVYREFTDHIDGKESIGVPS